MKKRTLKNPHLFVSTQSAKQKSLMFVGLFLLLSSMLVVSAATKADTILKISSNTNAHAEHYDKTAYTISVLYSDVFGIDYPEAEPHPTCSTGNTILALSSTTNAHAAESLDASYTIPVCYGDLVCDIKSTCGTDEYCVVTLSGTINAHLALCSTYASGRISGTAPYNNKLCCSSDVGSPSGYCQTFTTNDTCLSPSNPVACTWYPPNGDMDITSGSYCCGPEESIDPISGECASESSALCKYHFDSLLINPVRITSEGYSATQECDPDTNCANIDLTKTPPTYCAPVSRDISYGFWSNVEFY